MYRRSLSLFPLLLLLLLFLPGLVPTASAQAQVRRIAGIVRDGGNDPVANALVRISAGPQEGSTRTNGLGQYVLTGLAPGTYSLTAQKAGYNSAFRGSVPVVAGQTAVIHFQLSWGDPNTGSLEALVRTRRGLALPEAEVDLIRDNRVVSRGTTDEGGSFVFPGLAPGQYRVEVRRPGFRDAGSRFVRVRVRRLSEVTVRLRRNPNASGRLGGLVRTEVGAPIQGAVLRITAGPSQLSTASGSNGDYLLENLIPSSGYSLQVTAPGFAAQTLGNIRVQQGQLTVLNVTMLRAQSRRGSITGTVRELATGRGVSFARVRLTTGPDVGEEVQADVDGRYAFQGLTPSSGVALVAEAAGFSPGGASGLTIRGGRTTVANVDLRNQLVQPGTLRGVVREAGSGRLLPNVVVEITRGPSAGVAALTDAAGAYEIPGLIPDPSYSVRFSADGLRSLTLSPVSVTTGVVSTLNAELAPAQAVRATLFGTVTAFGGGPLAGVEVSLFQGASAPIRVVTGRDGTYRFRNLAADTDYGLRLSLQGFATEERTGIAVADGEEIRLDFVLRQGTGSGRIRGRVVDLLQRPVAGASVRVVEGPFLPAEEVRTDTAGAFVIPSLPRGTYTLEVSGAGIRTLRRGNIIVTPGRATSVLIQATQ